MEKHEIPQEAIEMFEKYLDYSELLKLIGCRVIYYHKEESGLNWYTYECDCHTPMNCGNHGWNRVSFEEILDQVPEEIQVKLLFHLDVFA